MPKCNLCNTRATFNIASEKTAKFCKMHKESGMIDVVNKKCEFDGCAIHPVYNIIGSKIGKFCFKHKIDGMIDIISKKCIKLNCKVRASFNFEGKQPPLYCSEHKLKDMINIRNISCIYEKCNLDASFNYSDQKIPKYCSKHKLDKMVNIKNKCKFLNCYKSPTYNYADKKRAIYCATHKLPDMINHKNKLCEFDNCTKQANFNLDGENSKFCYEHKTSEMVNVGSKKCKFCPTIVKNKYEGYCLRCFIHTFPDKPVSRNYKTKEKTVTDYILSTFPEYDWITDKKIQDGCSSRRPDMLLDLGYQVIIIEIDETQHKDYDCSCENKRIMELSKDVNHRPIVFIRFNPDEYIDEDNNLVKSCWYINNLGICCIKKEKEWNARLVALKFQIKYWCNPNNTTDKTIEIIQLYYDQNTEDITDSEEETEEINQNIKIEINLH